MRTCTQCHTEKIVEEFYINNGKPHAWCKACFRAARKVYREKNADKVAESKRAYSHSQMGRETMTRYRKENADHINKIRAEFISKNREHFTERERVRYADQLARNVDHNRAKNLRRNYGLTVEQYDSMYRSQNGVCAICSKVNVIGRRLAVDHNHATGQVRQLLCHNCNSAIGHAKESVEILKKTIAYLEKHQTLAAIGAL